MLLLLLLLLLLSVLTVGQNTGMWQNSGTDLRLSGSGVVLDDFGGTKITCAVNCLQHQQCVAFNHHEGDSQCQLLNTASYKKPDPQMVAGTGWKYYTQKYIAVQRIRDPCASDPCPVDSACVRYEQPVWEKFNNSLDFYACTRYFWIMDQKNANKECHFKILYDTDYRYADTAYNNVKKPFYEAFKNCLTYNCAALICIWTHTCFIKYTFHEREGQINQMSSVHYWYPVCM